MSRAALDHPGQHQGEPVQHALDVRVEDLRPLARVARLERLRAPRQAGVQHGEVDAAAVREGRGDRALEALPVGHVRDDGDRPLELRRERLEALPAAGDEQAAGALGGEGAGGGGPDPGGGAGDQGEAVLQALHGAEGSAPTAPADPSPFSGFRPQIAAPDGRWTPGMPTWILALALLGLAPPQSAAVAPGGGAEAPRPAIERPAPARLLVHGGRIYLGNEGGGAVEALLVEGGRVVAAGPLARLGVDPDEPGLARIDLGGAVAVPGLQDAHGQVEALGERLEVLDLEGVTDLDELAARVARAAEAVPPGEWIQGAGWDAGLLLDGELPTHAALSAAAPDHPVHLLSAGGGALLVNRRALVRAELHEPLVQAERLPGGRVLRDEEGVATGLFLGEAVRLLDAALPAVTRADRERRLLLAQDRLLALGLTCVHDFGVDPELVSIYLYLLARGALRLRVVAYLDATSGLEDEVLAGYPVAPDPRDLFCVPGISLRLDHGVGARGAALLRPYADRPSERGRPTLTPEALTLRVHRAWRAGLQPALEAHGDHATGLALDVVERMEEVDASFAELRPRVEFARVVSTRDMPRFPSLGVVPSLQPAAALEDLALLQRRLGDHRAEWACTWRDLAPTWTPTAFGSGFPAGDPDPLGVLAAARTPAGLGVPAAEEALVEDESLDGLEALACLTRGPALAAHQEDRRGQLMPGFAADLTVLDRDPVEAGPEALREARVLMTVVNGEVVFQR